MDRLGPYELNNIIQGDCLEAMRALPDNCIDTVITDPPYHLVSINKRFSKTAITDNNKTGTDARNGAHQYARLSSGFMGKKWDGGGIAFDPDTWVEVMRVAKPGAMLLAFGGTRTFHRLACAIEDAGWEIRDCLLWLYGSGFPKSHNIKKATGLKEWHGYGTALKPAWEPIVLAMKPMPSTFAANALEYGVAGLNIDGARVGTEQTVTTIKDLSQAHGNQFGKSGIRYPKMGEKVNPPGRFPANLIHDGSECVVEQFPVTTSKTGGKFQKSGDGWGTGNNGGFTPVSTYGDTGSAARYFYCAKASKRERNHGLPDGTTNKHPTVKPLALMEYLCTLTRPPTGGIVLDPFCGSGTTGVAAIRTGRRFIGIDQDTESCKVARYRLEAAKEEPEQLEMGIVDV